MGKSKLSRPQWITILAAFANSVLISAFPPFDYVSLDSGGGTSFSGFYWKLGEYPNLVVNTDFLLLEVFVILINASIAWLVVSSKKPPAQGKKQLWRNGVLWMVSVNLIVMLLFPPFENYGSVGKTVVPTFEGFYFVFADNSRRTLVTPILYIEIILLLVNAGLLLLFLNGPKQKKVGRPAVNIGQNRH